MLDARTKQWHKRRLTQNVLQKVGGQLHEYAFKLSQIKDVLIPANDDLSLASNGKLKQHIVFWIPAYIRAPAEHA